MSKILIALVFAAVLTSCHVPTYAEVFAACVADPQVQKRASDLGMTAEDLCRELLRESPDAAPSVNACSDGSCPLR